MTAKHLLLHEARRAYDSDEMCLLCGVYPWKWEEPGGLVRDPANDLTDEEAKVLPPGWYQPILAILEHVGWAKLMYMEQAYGPPPKAVPKPEATLESVLAYVAAAQAYTLQCLEAATDGALGEPVPTQYHGESAANLFWVLAQHDVYHGSQIEVLRDVIKNVPATD